MKRSINSPKVIITNLFWYLLSNVAARSGKGIIVLFVLVVLAEAAAIVATRPVLVFSHLQVRHVELGRPVAITGLGPGRGCAPVQAKGLSELAGQPRGPAAAALGPEKEVFASGSTRAAVARLEACGLVGQVGPTGHGRPDELVYGVGTHVARAVTSPLGGCQTSTWVSANGTGTFINVDELQQKRT